MTGAFHYLWRHASMPKDWLGHEQRIGLIGQRSCTSMTAQLQVFRILKW